ncbi:MAG: cadherin-like beta sandwich domain-containing protein [Ruminococcus sp.]|nr:cadherin-like beta sandwich domain-containing protein [Ruminococcus sp.]
MTKKTYFYGIFCIITCLCVFALGLSPISASAEAHGSFSIPDGAVANGEYFTVSVEFTASEEIGTVSAAISYNEDYMEFESSDWASGGGGIININGFPTGSTDSMTVDIVFLAKKEGVSQINLTNGSVMTPDGLILNSYITAYANITIADQAYSNSTDSTTSDSSLSDDSSYATSDSSEIDSSNEYDGLTAVLKSLTVESGELKPEFSPGIYNYTVTVSSDVIVFEMEGETANENDTIWYEGAKYLVDGKNQRTITVTSADGLTSNVYTVTIYREPSESDADESLGELESEQEQEAAVESVEEQSQDSTEETSSVESSSSKVESSDSETTGVQDLRDSLMPALYVAMAAIVVAVVILIVWIRTKSKNRMG